MKSEHNSMEFPKSDEDLLEQMKSIHSYHSEARKLSTLKDESIRINASAVGSEILKTSPGRATENDRAEESAVKLPTDARYSLE